MAKSDQLVNSVMSWKGFRRIIYAIVPITIFFVLMDIASVSWNFQCWNWMFYTGAVTFTTTIALATGVSKKLENTIEALRNNNSLILNANELEDIKTQMQRNARTWKLWCGISIFVVVFGSWIWVFRSEVFEIDWNAGIIVVVSTLTILFLIFFVMGVCGFYAGVFFGKMASMGMFASILASDEINLRIRPDHFDGAAGLKPIGDLYLYQAFLTGIPLLWFACWWLIIPVYESRVCAGIDYSSWRSPIIVQWLVTLTFTYLGFIKPIFKLRSRVLREQKRIRTEQFLGIKKEIGRLQQNLLDGEKSILSREKINSKIDKLAHYLWSVEKMSSWPMDAKTRRSYFSVNTLVGILPPMVQLLTSFGTLRMSLPDGRFFTLIEKFAGIFF